MFIELNICAFATNERLAVTKYVYDFTEGDRTMSDLLGGKGANLAEMTRLGLPVPPGFTITTEACKAYLAEGREPAEAHALPGHASAFKRSHRGGAAL